MAIADAAGGRWPSLAREACTALVAAASGSDDRSLGVRLLVDIRTAFGADRRLSTAQLVDRLADIDEWLDGKSDKARGTWLARRLRPYGISPRPVRIGTTNPRGYDTDDFTDAWRRYATDHNATNATSLLDASR